MAQLQEEIRKYPQATLSDDMPLTPAIARAASEYVAAATAHMRLMTRARQIMGTPPADDLVLIERYDAWGRKLKATEAAGN